MAFKDNINRLIKPLIALSAVIVCLSGTLHAENMYAKYKDTDITVRDRTGNTRDIPIILRDINDTAIIYSPMSYQQGQLELPLSNKELRLFFEYPREEWDKVLAALRLDNYEQAVELLRPMGYPLVKFLVVPEERFNGHEVVIRLYTSLIRSGKLDEALTLARKLPLEALNDTYLELTMELANAMVEVGDTIGAIRAIQIIPMNEKRMQMIPRLMEFANSLRVRSQYEAALILYDRIRHIPNEELQRTSNLWISYINLLLEQYDTAAEYLERVTGLEETDRAYSLYQLIEGRLLLVAGNTADAINTIAIGVVNSDVSYPWMPDLLYASALCYETMGHQAAAAGPLPEGNIDKRLVASNVYYQLSLFYPDSEWTEKGMARMASLPKPEEVKAALPDEVLKEQQSENSSDALLEDDSWEEIKE